MLRGSARATVGALVIGAGAAIAVLLSTWPLPVIERAPIAVAVDTLNGAQQSLVCPGSFAELGADPTRPGTAIPSGSATVVSTGTIIASSELLRAEAGGSMPAVLRAAAGDEAAAAQLQVVSSQTLRGLSAASCAEVAHEQWIVGGSTALGTSTTLSLGNPSDVPATVQIRLFDDNGEIAQGTTGVLVPAKSERTVSLNGYAPGRERIVVQVTSTGAAITASLGVGQVISLSPFAADTVTRQLAPSTLQVIPGVANISDHEHGGPGDAGDLDPFPVVVRMLAPGGETGSARLRAVTKDGTSIDLGRAQFAGGKVIDFPIQHWPTEADGLIIESSAPIVSGVQGSSDDGVNHDYAWFAPAPVIAAKSEFAAALVPGGQLVLVNPGKTEAKVTVTDAANRSQQQTVSVPAGAAMPVAATPSSMIESDAPIAAGVRVTAGGLAGYPVLVPLQRSGELTVFTR